MLSDDDALRLISGPAYGDGGAPHHLFAKLRALPRVIRVSPRGYASFWAAVRYEDIVEVSRNPSVFKSAGAFAIMPAGIDASALVPVRSLHNIDAPAHREARARVGAAFSTGALAPWGGPIEAMCREAIDSGRDRGHVLDAGALGAEVAAKVIARVFSLDDAALEATREAAESSLFLDRGAHPQDASAMRTRIFRSAYEELRRTLSAPSPESEVTSAIAKANLGELGLDPVWFLFGILSAGYQTMRLAMAGGVQAFAEHPEQWAQLGAQPDVIGGAAEEIVRWCSPVNHFARTAAEDYRLRDAEIRAGDSVALFFPSANRDERIFERPDEFLIERKPNPHVGYGMGAHHCAGMHLARLTLRTFFSELSMQVKTIEPAGRVQHLPSSFLAGMQLVPVRLVRAP